MKLVNAHLLVSCSSAGEAFRRGRANLSHDANLSIRISWRSWLLATTVALLQGCATTAASPTPATSSANVAEPQPPSDQPVARANPELEDETSVHPGINDHYFLPNGAQRYTRILEAESREIVRRRDDIVEAIGLRPGMAVADVGAGTGLLTIGMAERVGERGLVYAIDIVPEFLDLIRKRAEAAGLRNVRVVEGGERETGLPRASIDVAFMCDTYHHIEYPQAYLRSLHGAMRPGAALIMVDMIREEGESSVSVLRHVRAGKAEVIAELEEAGFVLESETKLLVENYYLHFRRR